MRESLERYQVVVYLAAVLTGGMAGILWPAAAGRLDLFIWPVLAILLYTTFCHVSLGNLKQAFHHQRFFSASLFTNFALVPLIVWTLSWLLPAEPTVRIGVFMVLLVPCTDWFVTFTYLGKGATRLAVAIVPIQLLTQFVLLPVYLWTFLGKDFIQAVTVSPFLQVFTWIIFLPFILATLTRYLANHHSIGTGWLRATAWLPVPLLALVLFIIVASQVDTAGHVFTSLSRPALVFVLYLVITVLLSRLIAIVFRLEPEAGRTLAFNMGTRNSFVILPLALALPVGWEATAAVVVLQSLIELSGMVVYLWLIPNLFPIKKINRVR
jgi:ACR3 family arsenite efflux pump ArsB